jgi:uncharacterized protein (TIGR03067 family)
MTLLAATSSLIVVAIVAFSAPTEEATMSEGARIEGVWRFDVVEVMGQRQPRPPYPAHRMIIAKDGRDVVVQDDRITRGTISWDATKSPGQFDVVIASGAQKGQRYPGIYELEGDTYRICLPLKSTTRPTNFLTTPDNGSMMQVLKREVRDPTDALREIDRVQRGGR